MSTIDYDQVYDEQMKKSLNENIKKLEETAAEETAEIRQQYQGAINLQNVQKLINERKVAEAMANAGLTDSGLNRTQQTATQLSYSNAVAQLELEKQKKVDSLARALEEQVGALKTNYAADKANYIEKSQKEEAATREDAYIKYNQMLETYLKATTREEKDAIIIEFLSAYPDNEYAWTFAGDEGYTTDRTGPLEFDYGKALAIEATTKEEAKKKRNTERTASVTKSEGDGGTYYTVAGETDENDEPIKYYGIENKGHVNGMDISGVMQDKLAEEFVESLNKKQFDSANYTKSSFYSLRNQYITAGYSAFEIDKYMEEKFGVLWLLAINGLGDYPKTVTETNNGGGNFLNLGIDTNAKIKIAGESNERKLGDVRSSLKEYDGVKLSAINALLKKYGQGK